LGAPDKIRRAPVFLPLCAAHTVKLTADGQDCFSPFAGAIKFPWSHGSK